MDTRVAKIMIGYPGGNASRSARFFRINIPSTWAKEMGIAPDARDAILEFDGVQITIRKAEATEGKN